jgi:ABC-type glycerol-3-phosphate transport system substrate-binding protein
MLKFKRFHLLALMLVLMLALTACGGGDKAEEETPADSETQTEDTNTDTDTETPPEDSTPAYDMKGEPIKIAAWWDADPRNIAENERTALDQLQVDLIAKAEEKYKTKIEFSVIDYGQIVEQFTTTSLAGEPMADIVRLELFWMFPKLVKDGFLGALEDYIEVDPEKVPAWMLEGGSYQGKQYGIVDSSPSGFGLWYNKTLLQKLGVEDPYELQAKGEWTWDKLIEIAKAATKDTDGDGTIDVYGIGGGARDLFHSFVYTNNAAVDVAEDGSEKFSLDSPNAMEAAQYFYDLFNTHKAAKAGDASQMFINGEIAIVPHFTWEVANYKQNMTDELGFVFFPKGPQASEYTTYTPFGNMWTVAKMSKNAQVAAMIMDEILLWAPLYPERDQLVKESRQATYPSAEIVDTVSQMADKVKYISYYAYPNAEQIMEEAVNNMKDGKETPATAIERIKPMFESAMKQILE